MPATAYPFRLIAWFALAYTLWGPLPAFTQSLRESTDWPNFSRYVVGVTVDRKATALGTVIERPVWMQADTPTEHAVFVLTKASETSADTTLRVVAGDGIPRIAQSIGTDRSSDLRLLRVPVVRGRSDEQADPTHGWQAVPIHFPEGIGPEPPAGTFTMAPSLTDTYAGIVAGPPRSIANSAKMGVYFADASPRAVVRSVQPGSGADTAGLQRGDTLTAIDGQPTPTPLAVIEAIRNETRYAGDRVLVGFDRHVGFRTQHMEVQIELGVASPQATTREQRLERQTGPTSRRRDGFASALPTDMPISANRCGGPAFDRQGRFLGIVIARAGRVETLLLPPQQITLALQRMEAQNQPSLNTPQPDVETKP